MRWFTWRLAWQRLCRSKLFSTGAMVSLAVAGVLVSLSVAWCWQLLNFQPSYTDSDQLWFVQLVDERSAWVPEADPEMQGSMRLARRFVDENRAFDATAWAKRASIPTRGRDSRPVSVLHVSRGFWGTLRPTIAAGAIPVEDTGELVLTHDGAVRRFGSATAAVGAHVVLGATAWRVAAVLGPDFVVPARSEPGISTIDAFIPAPGAETAEDRAQDALLIGRYAGGQTALSRLVADELDRLTDALGERYWRAEVRPLVEHLIGSNLLLSKGLAGIALLLAVSVQVGLLLLASGRFAQRRTQRFVLFSLGVRLPGQSALERAEVGLLVIGGLAIASILTLLCLSLMASNPLTAVLVTGDYRLAVVVALCASFALNALLLMTAAVRASRLPVDQRSKLRNAPSSASLLARSSLRTVQLAQAGIAVMAVTLLIPSLGDAWRTTRAVAARSLDGITEWQIVYPPGADPVLVEEDVDRLKRHAMGLPGVGAVGVALASGIDLASLYTVSYAGPRITGGEVVARRSDGSVVVRSDGLDELPDEIRYTLNLVPAEPEWLTIFGFDVIAGRAFVASEPDATLLTPTAARQLAAESQPLLGQPVPAPPAFDDGTLWHSGLQVTGIAIAPRITGAWPSLASLMARPIAFLPLADHLRAPAAGSPTLVYLAITHDPDSTVARASIERAMAGSPFVDARYRSVNVAVEARARAVSHWLASSGALLLGAMVLAAVGSGMAGTTLLRLVVRRQEFAIRLCCGATEKGLRWRVVRSQLAGPMLVVTVWVAFIEVLRTITTQHGFVLPVTTSHAIGGAALTVGIVGATSWIASTWSLREAPANALRAT